MRKGNEWIARVKGKSLVWTLVLGAAASIVLASPVIAGEFEDAHSRLTELEEKVRSLSNDFKETASVDSNVVIRRVLDAELLFKLKNYSEAATILLDVVEKYPKAKGSDDALLLLGECLFQQKDYISARRYYALVAKSGVGSRTEQRALLRLIEVALHTGDFEDVDEILKRLEAFSVNEREPSVPYVRGKYAFFRGRLDDALAAFNSIPTASPHYLQARYFAATVMVKKGEISAAQTAFQSLLHVTAKSDTDREIQDLARLSLGRLSYETSQFDKARDYYGTIGHSSSHFDEAMNELAWTSIKAKDFTNAYRVLDLILLQKEDNPRAPELRLLMGNLHVRLGNFALANDAFLEARGQFEPVERELRQTLIKCQNDPKFFESVTGKGLERFDISALIPKVAANWVRTEPEVARLVVMTEDVGDLQRGIKDSEQTLARLEMAVAGQLKVGIFPDLASVRTRSSEVLNQLVQIRQHFGKRMRDLILPLLAGDEKIRFEQGAVERAAIEAELANLPMTVAALKDREKQARGDLDRLDGKASELNVIVQGMEAELIAIEQYFIKSRGDQKIKPEDLLQPVANLHEALLELRSNNDRIRNEIAEAAREATVAAATGDSDRQAVFRLLGIMKREREFLQAVRTRLSGSDMKDFDAIARVLERADGVQSRLAESDAMLEAIALKRLGELKQQIARERTDLEAASAKLSGIVQESQTLGGGLAFAMLSKVTDRFYDLVVQSDVGLVDVAWGLKDSRTTTVSKLINQQKLELKSVEEDFRQLLEEEK
jgi:tetratricopeptide (TPR) repeat protein